ncbi:MAG: hypothetical protein AAB697_02090 [Patescibacteria group bacterium]
MKFILSLFLLLLYPSVALAKEGVSLSLSKDRRFVYLSFSDLKKVSRVNYTLVYDSASGQKGFEGGFRLNPKTSRSSRRQILGTCSSGRCVYHRNIKNVSLDATFTLRSGGTTNVTKSLP